MEKKKGIKKSHPSVASIFHLFLTWGWPLEGRGGFSRDLTPQISWNMHGSTAGSGIWGFGYWDVFWEAGKEKRLRKSGVDVVQRDFGSWEGSVSREKGVSFLGKAVHIPLGNAGVKAGSLLLLRCHQQENTSGIYPVPKHGLERLWLLHPWNYPRIGLGTTWDSERHPCPWKKGWNGMILRVPSRPKHSMIPCFAPSDFLQSPALAQGISPAFPCPHWDIPCVQPDTLQ